jgi:membrane-associated phospholipid phosphatase
MVLMMVSVLFMKIHYSIDVFAAPFISFGIFVLVDEFLRKKENIKIEEEWRMLNICDI